MTGPCPGVKSVLVLISSVCWDCKWFRQGNKTLTYYTLLVTIQECWNDYGIQILPFLTSYLATYNVSTTNQNQRQIKINSTSNSAAAQMKVNSCSIAVCMLTYAFIPKYMHTYTNHTHNYSWNKIMSHKEFTSASISALYTWTNIMWTNIPVLQSWKIFRICSMLAHKCINMICLLLFSNSVGSVLLHTYIYFFICCIILHLNFSRWIVGVITWEPLVHKYATCERNWVSLPT